MPIVRIDCREIVDWNSFHDTFAHTFGFPDFYGRNMDAWIECMTDLDDPGTGMTSVHGTASDPVVLQLDHSNSLLDEIYQAIVECAAFVNWRRIEMGDSAILSLSFCRTPMDA